MADDTVNNGNESYNEDPDFGLPEVTLTPIERGGSRRGGTVKSRNQHSGSGQSSNSGMIIALVVILFLVVAAVLWFFRGDIFPSSIEADTDPIEETTPDMTNNDLSTTDDTTIDDGFIDDNETTNSSSTLDDSSLDDDSLIDDTPNSPGSFEVVNDKTGRTYVIIGSFVDEDLAKDEAAILGKQGVSSKLLMPNGNIKFYRLSIADYPTISQAASELDDLKANLNKSELWIIKH